MLILERERLGTVYRPLTGISRLLRSGLARANEVRDCEKARKASAKAVWWPSRWRREVELAETRIERDIAEEELSFYQP